MQRVGLVLALLLSLALLACESEGASSVDVLGVDTVAGVDFAAPDIGVDSGGPSLPGGCLTGDYEAFFGLIHSHSTLSDGSGPPEQAFTHARDEAGLDVMVLTDHMEVFYGQEHLWFEGCGDVADTFYVPGAYLADCGYEYATSVFGQSGHNNVFYADFLIGGHLEIPPFYAELAACERCVGQFNHPGGRPLQTWNDYAYDAAADSRMHLMEFNGTEDPWSHFFRALDAGWHVSPTYNQDNHDTDWGTKDDRRTGLWMSELTREALRDTMVARRTFMSHDRDATIVMWAQDVCWMGSILVGLAQADLRVVAADAGEEGFATIELFGPGAALLGSFDCAGANPCEATFAVTVEGPTYVVARAIQQDGDPLVAAPIWFAQ